MSPLECMRRLAALVPRPRLHLIRFHGVLAPNAKLRAMVVPQGFEDATGWASRGLAFRTLKWWCMVYWRKLVSSGECGLLLVPERSTPGVHRSTAPLARSLGGLTCRLEGPMLTTPNDSTAAYSDAYVLRCSCTMRTTPRSFTIEILFALFTAPSLQ
jgi:hypothetical protein